MARLPYLNIDDLDEKNQDLLKRPINLFRQLVNSTGGARAFGTLGHYIRYKSNLDPRIREMAIIQVGFLTKSEYELFLLKSYFVFYNLYLKLQEEKLFFFHSLSLAP